MLSPLLSRKKKEGMLSEQVVELRNHRMVVGNGLRSRPGRAMTNAVENFWDSLSKDAADSAQAILDKLKDKAWSSPLVASIRDNGGITRANKDRMFELRFGYALDQVGIVPEYEIRGEGQSTIDFGFTSGGQRWRVEMVRLSETQAVKDATWPRVDADGIPWSGRILPTYAKDRKQSLEGGDPEGGRKDLPEMRVEGTAAQVPGARRRLSRHARGFSHLYERRRHS
jgi:hypothetical protein